MNSSQAYKELDANHLAERQDHVLLIDVRTQSEVERGIIKGAMHLPLHLLPLRAEELPRDKPIVIYCNSGARSAQACLFLVSKGFDHTYNLIGGILAWVGAGNTLTALSQ